MCEYVHACYFLGKKRTWVIMRKRGFLFPQVHKSNNNNHKT